MIWRISFIKFSDVLPAFTSAGAISSLWSICLRVDIFRRVVKPHGSYFQWIVLYLVTDHIEEWQLNNLITASCASQSNSILCNSLFCSSELCLSLDILFRLDLNAFYSFFASSSFISADFTFSKSFQKLFPSSITFEIILFHQ